jgi:hypothetical protein
MSRGDLRWRLTIPPDGSMPLDGAGPLLIRWDTGPHPAARLPDDGCELLGLEIGHPDPARVTRLLSGVGFTGPVVVVARPTVELAADVHTPTGVRRL